MLQYLEGAVGRKGLSSLGEGPTVVGGTNVLDVYVGSPV